MIQARSLVIPFLLAVYATPSLAGTDIYYCGALDDDGDPLYEYLFSDAPTTLTFSAFVEFPGEPFLQKLLMLSRDPASVAPIDIEIPKSACSISSSSPRIINCSASSDATHQLKVVFGHFDATTPGSPYIQEDVALSSLTITAAPDGHDKYKLDLAVVSQNDAVTVHDQNLMPQIHCHGAESKIWLSRLQLPSIQYGSGR